MRNMTSSRNNLSQNCPNQRNGRASKDSGDSQVATHLPKDVRLFVERGQRGRYLILGCLGRNDSHGAM